MSEAKEQICGDCNYLYRKDCLDWELCLNKEEPRLYTNKSAQGCTRFKKKGEL